jgi:Tfp pilus assembly protein PilW
MATTIAWILVLVALSIHGILLWKVSKGVSQQHHITSFLLKEVQHMSEEVTSLVAKIEALTVAAEAREQRDIAQDAITQTQIQTLQTTIDELRIIIGSGALSPADQAALNSAAVKVQATIDSLNAADIIPPVV